MRYFLLLLFFFAGCSDPNAKYIDVELTSRHFLKEKVLKETRDYYEVEFSDYIHRVYKDGKTTAPLFGSLNYYEMRLLVKGEKDKSMVERARDRGYFNHIIEIN